MAAASKPGFLFQMKDKTRRMLNTCLYFLFLRFHAHRSGFLLESRDKFPQILSIIISPISALSCEQSQIFLDFLILFRVPLEPYYTQHLVWT